jgi:hypothetical protein
MFSLLFIGIMSNCVSRTRTIKDLSVSDASKTIIKSKKEKINDFNLEQPLGLFYNFYRLDIHEM